MVALLDCSRTTDDGNDGALSPAGRTANFEPRDEGEGPPLLRVDESDSGAAALFSFSTRCSAKWALKTVDMGRRLRLGNSVADDGALTYPCEIVGLELAGT